MDASTPGKNPVDARRARKKLLDARGLQLSPLDPYLLDLSKRFPDSEHHYPRVVNVHANANCSGLLG